MFCLIIVLNLLEACLILASAFIRIPEWISICGGCIIMGLVFCLWRFTDYSNTKRITLSLLSVLSVSWATFSAYAIPYWNSTTLSDVIGIKYKESKGLDDSLAFSEAKEDIDFAVSKLIKIHPSFLEFPEKVKSYQELFSLDRRDSISVEELYRHIQSRVSLLNDAHTKVFPVLSNHHIIDYNDFGELVSINGINAIEVKGSLKRYISSESDKWAEATISSNICSYEWLKLFGLINNGTIDLGFINSFGNYDEYTLTKEDFTEYVNSSNSLSADKIGTYYFDEATSTGILKLDNLYYYTPSQRDQFNNGIADFFKLLIDKHYEQLIIDLRNNPGGNAEIVHEIIKYLPIKEYSLGYRYHRYGHFWLGKHIVKKNKTKNLLHYYGDVYVLTSTKTFSGAMHLADYLQGNGLAKIVGESPGNLATCYTDIVHFILPNSRLSLNISTAKFIRVNGLSINKAIVPDIQCDSNESFLIATEQNK